LTTSQPYDDQQDQRKADLVFPRRFRKSDISAAAINGKAPHPRRWDHGDRWPCCGGAPAATGTIRRIL